MKDKDKDKDLVSYGDNIPPGKYSLHSAFENAINFRKGRFLVSFVTPAAGAGPANIVMRRLPKGAREFRASQLCFYLDHNRLRKDPGAEYDSHVPAAKIDADGLQHNLSRLKKLLLQRGDKTSMAFIFSPSPEKFFRRGFERNMYAAMKRAVALFYKGEYAAGARMLRGLGFGLTPSGDDFICGMMSGYAFASKIFGVDNSRRIKTLYRNALGKNLVSNSFLKCCRDGLVTAKTKKLMLSLAGAGDLESAAKESLKTGHTSGADFCAGLIFALENILRGERARA